MMNCYIMRDRLRDAPTDIAMLMCLLFLLVSGRRASSSCNSNRYGKEQKTEILGRLRVKVVVFQSNLRMIFEEKP